MFKNLKGAIPQGSWLGPLAFLVRIDDLSAGCPLHKYVDGTTLSELVQPKQLDTHILTYFRLIHLGSSQWYGNKYFQNQKMVLGHLANLPLPNIASQTVERVTTLHTSCLVYTLTQPSPGPPTLNV